MKQKGFIAIPLLMGIIASVIAISAVTTGMILHKQGKLTPLLASVYKVFESTEDIKLEIKPEEPQLEEKQPPSEETGQEENSQAEQELEQAKVGLKKAQAEAERAQAEAKKAQAEAKKAEQEAEKAKAEAGVKAETERLKVEYEAQRLAEEEKVRQEAEAEINRIAIENEKRKLETLLKQELNNYFSQVDSLNSQILTKEAEINAIYDEYEEKIRNERNRLASMSTINAGIAKLTQERNDKIAPLVREYNSLINQYNLLTGNPLSISNNQLSNNFPEYLKFYPDGMGGGDLYNSSGSFHIKVEPTAGGFKLYFNY